ncbi:MAG: 6-carboxytetrahydropterin synthase [Acidobacteriota bacterium]
MKLTGRYRFVAAHRLDTPTLTPEQNRRLYGKCNNPYGHGHDYIVDITIEGAVDSDGLIASREQMDALVKNAVLQRVDHKNLNVDLAEFHSAVPTTENLATVIRAWLEEAWTLPAKLVAVRISETERNTFIWEAGKV